MKPFLIFLLIISVLLSLALIIITLVQLYDEKNITFLVLVIADFSVLGIFAFGLIIVGVRYVFAVLIKKEEVKCVYCGKIVLGKTNICSNCANEKKVT